MATQVHAAVRSIEGGPTWSLAEASTRLFSTGITQSPLDDMETGIGLVNLSDVVEPRALGVVVGCARVAAMDEVAGVVDDVDGVDGIEDGSEGLVSSKASHTAPAALVKQSGPHLPLRLGVDRGK